MDEPRYFTIINKDCEILSQFGPIELERLACFSIRGALREAGIDIPEGIQFKMLTWEESQTFLDDEKRKAFLKEREANKIKLEERKAKIAKKREEKETDSGYLNLARRLAEGSQFKKD